MICPSTVYLLSDEYEYPEANGYGEVKEILNSVGGEAVNTAIMLSKLGIPSVLDGTWIIEEKFKTVRELLNPFDIDITRIKNTEFNGPSEIVIADRENRTCFGNFDTYQNGCKKWNNPKEEDFINASIVALDPYYPEESLKIAQLCNKNRIPYVTLDANYDDYIAQNAEAITISQEFIGWNYPEMDQSELFELYQKNCNGLIIFTYGNKNIKFGRKGKSINNIKPYEIEPVDTTAAGDTFRSGIIYGVLNNMSDQETVKFASAVSACVCLSVPHSLNATDLDGVLKFMKSFSL